MRYAIRIPIRGSTRLHEHDARDMIAAVLWRTEEQHGVKIVKYTAEIDQPPGEGPYLVVVGYTE